MATIASLQADEITDADLDGVAGGLGQKPISTQTKPIAGHHDVDTASTEAQTANQDAKGEAAQLGKDLKNFIDSTISTVKTQESEILKGFKIP